mmetsp:Transcript_1738/g.2597  ORF Transcript_1738/g.2597 Transcript_1738/m.2597 type:complete len:426 (+) Transcript_1738:463-1740(+)
MWITWSPISSNVARNLWHVNESAVDQLSSVYMYVYILLSFPALYLLHSRFKLKRGLVVASCINLAGSVIRFWYVRSYTCVYIGTMLCAVAQTLTLAIPPLLSGNWFGAHERAMATSLGVLANQMGTAVGLGATVIVDLNISTMNDNSDEGGGGGIERLQRYVGVQCVFSLLAAAMVVVWVENDPPTPPSAASEATHLQPISMIPSEEEDPTTAVGYLESIRLVLLDRSGFLFAIVYGLSVGVFYAVATFLSQFVTPQHSSWSSVQIGWLGIDLVVVGVMGSVLSGYVLDRTQNRHRMVTCVLLAGSVCSILFFLFATNHQNHTSSSSSLEVFFTFLSTACVGFFLTSLISVGFEYGTAMAYPADEAAVAGVLNCSAQVGGFVLVWVGGALPDVGLLFSCILAATLIVSIFILLFGVTASSKRPNH